MKVPALFNPDWLNKRDRRGHRRSDTIKVLAKAIIHDFLTFNVPHMAASIAFWGLFSMFPMVLAIVIITGDFVSYDSFIDRVGSSVPVSQDFITDTLTDVSNDWPYTGTVAVIGLGWASLSVFAATRKGINAAWAIFNPRSFLRERVIDFSLMLGSWMIFILSLSITPIIEFSRNTAATDSSGPWGGTWLLLGWGLPLLLTFAAFSSLYRYIPQHPSPVEGRMACSVDSRHIFRSASPRLRLVRGPALHLQPGVRHRCHYGRPVGLGLLLRRHPPVRGGRGLADQQAETEEAADGL